MANLGHFQRLFEKLKEADPPPKIAKYMGKALQKKRMLFMHMSMNLHVL